MNRINLIIQSNGKYLSDFARLYKVIEPDKNIALNEMSPLVKPIRYGGNKYDSDPYLNRLTFQTLEQNDEFIEVREFSEHFDPAQIVLRDITVIYRIPLCDLEKDVKLIALTKPVEEPD